MLNRVVFIILFETDSDIFRSASPLHDIYDYISLFTFQVNNNCHGLRRSVSSTRDLFNVFDT